jgi:hypothetical protein
LCCLSAGTATVLDALSYLFLLLLLLLLHPPPFITYTITHRTRIIRC